MGGGRWLKLTPRAIRVKFAIPPGEESLAMKKDELRENKLALLRAEIQIADYQAHTGQISRFNDATLQDVRSKGRERLTKLKAAKDENVIESDGSDPGLR
jgi:hypothetical protein